MPPNSKKRAVDGNGVQDSLRGNVIAPTPKKKQPRNDPDFETPRRLRAPIGNSAAAVIPGSGTAASINHNDANVDSSLLVSPPGGRPSRRQNGARALNNRNARRNILPENNGSPESTLPAPVTPAQGGSKSKTATVTPSPKDANKKPAAQRRLFGKLVDGEGQEITTQPNTKRVYSIVKTLTGALGGNGSSGPIYGELTQGSMQKMINLMQQHTQLDKRSRFIDVGSGIGKPNLHVTQDPGVAFSCGIEMELDRWRLGIKCLEHVLKKAVVDANNDSMSEEEKIRHNCMFLHENIMNAKTFDPFTHVYMFSIGFPPKLWVYLSEAWNRSRSPYMICYSAPRKIIDDYEFDVELVVQTPTSMHASGEGHTAYIYQRKGLTNDKFEAYIQDAPCDKVFEPAKRHVESGLDNLKNVVDQTVAENWAHTGRPMTRSEGRRLGVVLSKI